MVPPPLLHALLDRGPWELVLDMLRELPPPEEEAAAALGWELLRIWREGRLGREATQRALPSVRLLARVEASVFLDAVVDYGWRLARQLGLQGVWVPASPAIHSNRWAIHEELERLGWTLRGGKLHGFSTEPYRYSFDQVLEAPERYLPDIPAP